jgi:transcriptional regulator with XRE-family HTH domain
MGLGDPARGGGGMNERDIVADLKRVRKEQKVTQQHLADAAGYDRYSIRRYEAGIRAPNLAAACAFAEVLGYQLVLVKKDGAAE